MAKKNAKPHDESDKYSRILRVCEKRATSEATNMGQTGETTMASTEDRVTMKLDVAHTEHSHLIGKGGHCVKAMMLETQCHIHFPDSNRAPNVVEKSNQVSVSGRLADVEKARKRIRQMLPLVYIFTIQNSSPHALTLYRTSYIVQHLETKFSVEVTYRHYFAFPLAELTFRHHPHAKYFASNNTIVVSVRGLVLFAQQVIEATKVLLEHHFGRMAEHTHVWMTLDVEPKHQTAMLNHMAPRSLADVIHESTGAQVWFPQDNYFNATATATPLSPSPSPLSISPRRSGFYAPRLCPTPSLTASSLSLFQRPEARTMINILGTVNGCFMARQTLMTLLPVTLIAEISGEEALILSRIDFSTFKSSHDVGISLRAKPRHSFLQSLVLKTNEANTNSLYTVLCNLKFMLRSRARAEYGAESRAMLMLEDIHSSPTSIPPIETYVASYGKEQDVKTELEKEASLRRYLSRFPSLGTCGTTWIDHNRSPSPRSQFVSRPPSTHPASLDNFEVFPAISEHLPLSLPSLTSRQSGGTAILSDIFEKFSLSSRSLNPASMNYDSSFDDARKNDNQELEELIDFGQDEGFPKLTEPMWPKLPVVGHHPESGLTREEPVCCNMNQCTPQSLPSWYSAKGFHSGLFLNPWNDKSTGKNSLLG